MQRSQGTQRRNGSHDVVSTIRGLTRRQFLRGVGAASLAAFFPGFFPLPENRKTSRPPGTGFLDTYEFTTLESLVSHILPTDSLPGARELGVADYVQSLLTFGPGTDANCDASVSAADLTAAMMTAGGRPAGCPGAGDVDGSGSADKNDVELAPGAVFGARPWFAGGPFSDRNPQPHLVATGGRPCAACHSPGAFTEDDGPHSTSIVEYVVPPNFFERNVPLTRLQRLSWQVRLNGAATVPEVAGNPLAGELLETDLRRRYRQGLAELDAGARQRFGMRFAQLAADQREAVIAEADPSFLRLVTFHVIEGTLCAPEYGGNRDRLGWRMTGFGGDSQPLGYTIWDPEVGGYIERPERPNSGPDPHEDCSGFSPAMRDFLRALASLVAGVDGVFSDPYCFEVDRWPSRR